MFFAWIRSWWNEIQPQLPGPAKYPLMAPWKNPFYTRGCAWRGNSLQRTTKLFPWDRLSYEALWQVRLLPSPTTCHVWTGFNVLHHNSLNGKYLCQQSLRFNAHCFNWPTSITSLMVLLELLQQVTVTFVCPLSPQAWPQLRFNDLRRLPNRLQCTMQKISSGLHLEFEDK